MAFDLPFGLNIASDEPTDRRQVSANPGTIPSDHRWAGMIVWNSTSKSHVYYDGAAFHPLGGGAVKDTWLDDKLKAGDVEIQAHSHHLILGTTSDRLNGFWVHSKNGIMLETSSKQITLVSQLGIDVYSNTRTLAYRLPVTAPKLDQILVARTNSPAAAPDPQKLSWSDHHMGDEAYSAKVFKDFKVNNDGVTDTIVSLQKACTKILSEDRDLHIPPGKYLISKPLYLSNGNFAKLKIVGYGATVIIDFEYPNVPGLTAKMAAASDSLAEFNEFNNYWRQRMPGGIMVGRYDHNHPGKMTGLQWSNGHTFNNGDVVMHNYIYWESLKNSNRGTEPGTDSKAWTLWAGKAWYCNMEGLNVSGQNNLGIAGYYIDGMTHSMFTNLGASACYTGFKFWGWNTTLMNFVVGGGYVGYYFGTASGSGGAWGMNINTIFNMRCQGTSGIHKKKGLVPYVKMIVSGQECNITNCTFEGLHHRYNVIVNDQGNMMYNNVLTNIHEESQTWPSVSDTQIVSVGYASGRQFHRIVGYLPTYKIECMAPGGVHSAGGLRIQNVSVNKTLSKWPTFVNWNRNLGFDNLMGIQWNPAATDVVITKFKNEGVHNGYIQVNGATKYWGGGIGGNAPSAATTGGGGTIQDELDGGNIALNGKKRNFTMGDANSRNTELNSFNINSWGAIKLSSTSSNVIVRKAKNDLYILPNDSPATGEVLAAGSSASPKELQWKTAGTTLVKKAIKGITGWNGQATKPVLIPKTIIHKNAKDIVNVICPHATLGVHYFTLKPLNIGWTNLEIHLFDFTDSAGNYHGGAVSLNFMIWYTL